AAARRRVHELARRLHGGQARALAARQRELRQLTARLVSPRRRLELASQRIDELAQRLGQAATIGVRLRRGRLDNLRTRLAACSPANRLRLDARELVHLRARLLAAGRDTLRGHRERLARQAGLLRALGPGPTLERGYAIVSDGDGRIVRAAATLQRGDVIHARLARGGFSAEVREAGTDMPAVPAGKGEP
ncbi:MAG: exodeoxyribonuclease VII large subunit, partial [Gammaproteobacteria bacterium]